MEEENQRLKEFLNALQLENEGLRKTISDLQRDLNQLAQAKAQL